MHIKDLKNCPEFIAGDGTFLRELLHPDKERLKLRYSLAHATLRPGKKSTPHKLKTSEVYFILKGKGLMHIENKAREVSPNQIIYIPPNSVQYIENSGTEELSFLCIVDPAWKKEDEKIIN